jgi:hypothetical protein
MTMTIEEANAAIRGAVTERMEATPADDPKMVGYRSETYAEWQPPAFARHAGDGLLGNPIGSTEWLEAIEQLRQLHFEKTAAYGDSDPFANVTASAKCGVEPWRRALCDLSDCVVRMQRYANGQPVDYENALMDAANWALICLVKLRESKA